MFRRAHRLILRARVRSLRATETHYLDWIEGWAGIASPELVIRYRGDLADAQRKLRDVEERLRRAEGRGPSGR
jgi:hypothetical protein